MIFDFQNFEIRNSKLKKGKPAYSPPYNRRWQWGWIMLCVHQKGSWYSKEREPRKRRISEVMGYLRPFAVMYQIDQIPTFLNPRVLLSLQWFPLVISEQRKFGCSTRTSISERSLISKILNLRFLMPSPGLSLISGLMCLESNGGWLPRKKSMKVWVYLLTSVFCKSTSTDRDSWV